MQRITPIVRGQGKAFRFTFMDADTEEILDTTDWTLFTYVGRSRGQIDTIHTSEDTPDEANAAQGIISTTIPDTVTADIKSASCVLKFKVDANTGNSVLLMFAQAAVLSEADYDNIVYESNNGSNNDTPTYVSGEEPIDIQIVVFNDIDPTFDVGVLVKFDEVSPGTITYLEALQADVTQKHSEVMSA